MQSVDCHELDRMLDNWDVILKEYPIAKHNLMVELGDEMLKLVKENIENSGMKSTKGTLAGFQSRHIGSKRGYAAVRADRKPEGDNGAGAITNYTENGHKVRRPSQSLRRKRRYISRAEKASVDGYHYYDKAKSSIEQWDEGKIRKFAENLARRLNGGGS